MQVYFHVSGFYVLERFFPNPVCQRLGSFFESFLMDFKASLRVG